MKLTLKNTLFLTLLVPIGLFSWGVFVSDIASWHHGGDYGHYYASALRLLEGRNPYSGTLEDLLTAHGFPLGKVEWRATNPPALILLTIPFTLVPAALSFWLWNLFQFAVFVLGAHCFCSILPKKPSRAVFLLSLLGTVASIPFVMHMRLGQTQLLVVGLVMIGLSLLHAKPRLAAFTLGVCASLKLFTLPLLLVVARRAFSEEKKDSFSLLYFPLGFILFTAIAESMANGFLIRSYIEHVIPYVKTLQFHITWGASLSFAVFFLIWWFGYNFDAPPNLPELVGDYINIGASAFLLLLLAIENFASRSAKDYLPSGVFILLASLLCSPVAWPHYYVLLYPAFLLLWCYYQDQPLLPQLIFLVLYVGAALTIGFTLFAPLATALWGPVVILSLLVLLITYERRTQSNNGADE